ncbi:MAG: UDP-N-acetylmuramoyl-L-alanyl-D-glutamate--2,6-diaminopimelate ligase, partial [Pseudohongiellaceae bacterium]
DAISLQRIMEEMRFNKGQIMTMEVSSHGLKQNRVNVCEFDVAVFTNLSRDHLDYHGSMKAYGEVKLKLFNNPQLKIAVVNLDDLFSVEILNNLARGVKSLTYSLKNQRADIYPVELNFNPAGLDMKVVTPWGSGTVKAPLLGSFNASNLLAAMATVLATEADKDNFNFTSILKVFSQLSPVRGRMQIIGTEAVQVVVDYAHTPDGLKKALQALKEHHSGAVWCVFGCGGNRDKGKRPLMAQIAEELADHLIITDDNPRQEPSEVIIAQILAGVRAREAVTVESNRAAAIELAITKAAPGDAVLIAGKGHEEYQDVGGNRMAFSDVKQARLCLNKRFKS